MRIGNFSLLIEGGIERNKDVVKVPGGRYTLTIVSHTKKCDAAVSIDGRVVGRYRLASGEGLSLPLAGEQESNTFLATEGGSLVSVRFQPEYVLRVSGAEVKVSHAPGDKVVDRQGIECPPIDHNPQGETVIAVRVAASPPA